MIIWDKFETTHTYVYVYNIKIMLYCIICKYVYMLFHYLLRFFIVFAGAKKAKNQWEIVS